MIGFEDRQIFYQPPPYEEVTDFEHVGSFESEFMANLYWESDIQEVSSVFNEGISCPYISLILGLMQTSLGLYIPLEENNDETSYTVVDMIACGRPGGIAFIYAVNDIEDGSICLCYAFGERPSIVQDFPSRKLSDIKPALEFIYNFDKHWSPIFKEKQGIQRQHYMKISRQQFLKDVLESFDKYIADIPESSIFWKTELVKNLRSNYDVLRSYSEEKGWV